MQRTGCMQRRMASTPGTSFVRTPRAAAGCQRGGACTAVRQQAAQALGAQQQQHEQHQQQQHQQRQHPAQQWALSRRQLLHGGAAAGAGLVLGAPPTASAKFESTQVGSYLPPAGVDDLVMFVPDGKKTPAIRAGTVSRDAPYRFALPPSWREAKVANILSGNYCQPRCAEPWIEVIFESEAEGRAQVVVAPLVRLTNRKGVAIQDIGPPSGIIASLGPFITGTYLDEEDIVSAAATPRDDGLTYYSYDIYAPYGTAGPHTLSACTVKGDIALLFVVAATDKQWSRNEAQLRKMVDSFRA